MEKGDTDLASLLKNYALHKEITPAMVKHYWTEMLHAVNVIHKVILFKHSLLIIRRRYLNLIILFF